MAEFEYEYDWENREIDKKKCRMFFNHLDDNLSKRIFGDKAPDVSMFKEQVTSYLDKMVKESKIVSNYEITATEVSGSEITFTISYQKV